METSKIVQFEVKRYLKMRQTVLRYILVTICLALAFLITGAIVFVIYVDQGASDKVLFLVGALALAVTLAIICSMFLPYLNLRNVKQICETNISFHFDPNSSIERIKGAAEIMELGDVVEYVQASDNLTLEKKKNFKPQTKPQSNITYTTRIFKLQKANQSWRYPRPEAMTQVDQKHLYGLDQTGQVLALLAPQTLVYEAKRIKLAASAKPASFKYLVVVFAETN